jgi:hypothetical protein
MKTQLSRLLAATLLFGATVAVQAQRYNVDWFRVAAGGGTSTNTQFAVSGTIGQHDASGPMTDGRYSVTGGFWQTPGGPLLTVRYLSPNQIEISWVTPAVGCFALEQTGSLSAPIWTAVPDVVSYASGVNEVVVTISANAQFFRLVSNCE